ncbi:hypothetical protein P175DRAFT_0442671 [Aspergillus ochraceoroseus IBT 24754]|nr:uncharacterized protein P175DRAFT_0442671 [Aspergillus ochraceoroseus IBT 24754]KKK21962.1 hypothetical protein AOCH_006710 [Aspergillus ochraceoroseus]PTU18974.1 hypothetical protein P175DRAFT_0442671 [Aspergillus ochraceoroseus IBT 24754]
MDANVQRILSLQAVREKSQIVFGLAKQGLLNHFDYHAERLDAAVDYVIGIIERDFGPDRYHEIPPHGRWQHFEVGGVPRVAELMKRWDELRYDNFEKVRSLIDLFFVSVLLDAGAGDRWSFREPDSGNIYTRSEGIAVASLYMFLNGDFANKDSPRKDVVHGEALRDMSIETLYRGFQIDEDKNPLVGASARVEIIQKLGKSMLNHEDIFGPKGRPGLLVDCLTSTGGDKVDYSLLWSILQKTLIPIWPSDRTRIAGNLVGDAWPLSVLAKDRSIRTQPPETATIQPFHKLTQWLAYSLKVPFERLLSLSWTNAELGTGLPEYRNGGLFVDMGVLTLKPEAMEKGLRISRSALPCFGAGDDEIVEWRAMTVALLDELHQRILSSARFGDVRLSLPQVLEAGSWKAGRELAAAKRPETKSSPILNSGDGTLF